MKKFFSIAAYLAVAGLLLSCGEDNSLINGGGGGGGNPTVASVTILASSPQLQSDAAGANYVDITATVADASNNVLKDVTVSLVASSGRLANLNLVTDVNGIASGRLNNGPDPSNRAITVTASANNINSSVVVNVIGTTLKITGPISLTQGAVGNYTMLLQDSKGIGISGKVIQLASSAGNALAASATLTGATGDLAFTLTANNAGTDTVTATATALSLTGTVDVAVSGDVFDFLAPAAGANMDISLNQTVQVQWTQNGVPQAGQPIDFATSRGTLVGANPATTDAAGIATIQVISANAGPTVLTATTPAPSSTTATRNADFVSTSSATVDLQASPFTVAPNGQSQLTAIVRDAAGNLVKNKTVVFSIVTDDSNGSVSPAQSSTTNQGVARSVYTGGPVAGRLNGVQITATVQDNPAATGTTNLTVAQQELFLALGTGNDIFEIGTSTFAKEWVVLVTDQVGNAVANKAVQLSVKSVNYLRGHYVYDSAASPPGWIYSASPPLSCADEDLNQDGILQPAEDINTSGRIEAGNVSAVAPVPASAPPEDPCSGLGGSGVVANVTTDSVGRARVCVIYPQSYNGWADVKIEAQASVAGTEFSRHQTFRLEGKASDFASTSPPPGVVSPFGDALPATVCGSPIFP